MTMEVSGYVRGVPTYADLNGKTYGMLCETKEKCITDDSGVALDFKLEELRKQIANSGINVDASTLEGHNAAHFATAESVTNITNGTTKVGNADKLDGHGAEYFAPKADLAYYIEADGSNGWVNSVADLNTFYTGITLTNSSLNTPTGDGEWWLVIAGGATGTTTQIAYSLFGVIVPKFRYCAASVWSEWYDLNKEYLPLTGGTVNGSIKANGIESTDGFVHSTRSGKLHLFKFTDSVGEWGSQIRDYKADGSYNSLIFQNTNKIFWGTFDANNTKTGGGEILHTGNSSKVVISQTAPSDTSALWVW